MPLAPQALVSDSLQFQRPRSFSLAMQVGSVFLVLCVSGSAIFSRVLR